MKLGKHEIADIPNTNLLAMQAMLVRARANRTAVISEQRERLKKRKVNITDVGDSFKQFELAINEEIKKRKLQNG